MGIVAGFSCWQITFDFWGFKPVTLIRWLHLDIEFKWTRHCGSIHRSWLLLIGYTVNYWDEPISERLCGFCTIFVIEAILFFFFTVYFLSPSFVILLKGPKCDRIYAYLCSFPIMLIASLRFVFNVILMMLQYLYIWKQTSIYSFNSNQLIKIIPLM